MTEPTQPTILVVEDEALLLFTIADDLRDAGFNVLEATNAAAALPLLEQGEPQVLFTDVDMPGTMNGLALAQLVHVRWPQTQIIVTSGHVNLSARDLPPGGTFLSKPYLPEMLFDAIRRNR